MTMHCFCSGELIRDPERKRSSKGTEYTAGLMKSGEELVNLTAFDTGIADRLAGLRKGAALACSGRLSARPYADKDGTLRAGLSVVVSELMPASLPPTKAAPKPRGDRSRRPAGAGADFDDALPDF